MLAAYTRPVLDPRLDSDIRDFLTTVSWARLDHVRRWLALAEDRRASPNDIVRQLDYVDPRSTSVGRHRRSPSEVVAEVNRLLTLVADLIGGAADVLRAK